MKNVIRASAACVAFCCLPLGQIAHADSNVGTFSSVVTIQGPVNQTATGSNVKQDLNVGSAQNSRANSFSSVVTTGSITQTGNNGAQQVINVGGMTNSKADRFDAKVNTGNIEQVANRGERQELDIGSVTNSTVNGTATTRVSVGAVKQVGEGEIVLGAVKNSNVQQFQSNLSVQGKVEGNNIRMGSVVGQERFDNQGRYRGQEATGTGAPNADSNFRLTMPNFSQIANAALTNPLTGPGSLLPSPTFNNGNGQKTVPALDKVNNYEFDNFDLVSIKPDEVFSESELKKLGFGKVKGAMFFINQVSNKMITSYINSGFKAVDGGINFTKSQRILRHVLNEASLLGAIKKGETAINVRKLAAISNVASKTNFALSALLESENSIDVVKEEFYGIDNVPVSIRMTGAFAAATDAASFGSIRSFAKLLFFVGNVIGVVDDNKEDKYSSYIDQHINAKITADITTATSKQVEDSAMAAWGYIGSVLN